MSPSEQIPLRLAVIGAGVMGKRHVAAAKRVAGIELVAVIDTDLAQAKAAAEIGGCASCADLSTLSGKIDAAVIAAPTAAHVPCAAPLLRVGIACLVEKPLAATEAECRALIAAAKDGGAVLQVGHIERFNPAIETLTYAALPPASIKAISARRMSAASARVLDIDVVMDLMVHDIDVVLTLKKTPVAHVSARGNDDHAVTLVSFTDGAVATLTASRVTATRIRDLDVVTAEEFFHVDYIAKTATKSRRRGDGANFDVSALAVTGTDALSAQLEDFVASVRGGKAPRVTGEDALATMVLTAQIRSALKA